MDFNKLSKQILSTPIIYGTDAHDRGRRRPKNEDR